MQNLGERYYQASAQHESWLAVAIAVAGPPAPGQERAAAVRAHNGAGRWARRHGLPTPHPASPIRRGAPRRLGTLGERCYQASATYESWLAVAAAELDRRPSDSDATYARRALQCAHAYAVRAGLPTRHPASLIRRGGAGVRAAAPMGTD